MTTTRARRATAAHGNPADCGRRVVRGGSWVFEPGIARSASRGGVEPGFRDDNLGFRLARTL